jgi:hypothetical protein
MLVICAKGGMDILHNYCTPVVDIPKSGKKKNILRYEAKL